MSAESALVHWKALARDLRPLGLQIFANSTDAIASNGLSEIKVLGLLLLARTLSNLKASLILVDAGSVIEARAIVRCCFENQFWVAALVTEGDKFRAAMVNHEIQHKRIRAQNIFETGVGLSEDIEEKMRSWMREHKQYADAKTLDPKSVASKYSTQSYVFYQHLSWDAHPSLETLNRYYHQPDPNGSSEISVEPTFSEDIEAETLFLLCLPVLGVLMGVVELLGHTSLPAYLESAVARYRALMERYGDQVTPREG